MLLRKSITLAIVSLLTLAAVGVFLSSCGRHDDHAEEDKAGVKVGFRAIREVRNKDRAVVFVGNKGYSLSAGVAKVVCEAEKGLVITEYDAIAKKYYASDGKYGIVLDIELNEVGRKHAPCIRAPICEGEGPVVVVERVLIYYAVWYGSTEGRYDVWGHLIRDNRGQSRLMYYITSERDGIIVQDITSPIDEEIVAGACRWLWYDYESGVGSLPIFLAKSAKDMFAVAPPIYEKKNGCLLDLVIIQNRLASFDAETGCVAFEYVVRTGESRDRLVRRVPEYIGVIRLSEFDAFRKNSWRHSEEHYSISASTSGTGDVYSGGLLFNIYAFEWGFSIDVLQHGKAGSILCDARHGEVEFRAGKAVGKGGEKWRTVFYYGCYLWFVDSNGGIFSEPDDIYDELFPVEDLE